MQCLVEFKRSQFEYREEEINSLYTSHHIHYLHCSLSRLLYEVEVTLVSASKHYTQFVCVSLHLTRV